MLLLALPLVVTAYGRYARPWQLTWGATPAEVSRAWPSDELVRAPDFNATRSITIDAPPELVWPWRMGMHHRDFGPRGSKSGNAR
jgi:hypothetical protein